MFFKRKQKYNSFREMPPEVKQEIVDGVTKIMASPKTARKLEKMADRHINEAVGRKTLWVRALELLKPRKKYASFQNMPYEEQQEFIDEVVKEMMSPKTPRKLVRGAKKDIRMLVRELESLTPK